MQIHPPHVTESEVLERRRLGLDILDEEWEGVYHVTASPSFGHQQVQDGLVRFLGTLLESRGGPPSPSGLRRAGGTVVSDFNVFRENARKRDFSIPDLLFVAAGRENIIADDGIRGGAPDAVFEILSPNDESYAKFAFYAAIGVPEVVVVEPKARTAEVWRLADGRYERVPAGGDGAVVSERIEISLRTIPGNPPRLEVVDRRDPAQRAAI